MFILGSLDIDYFKIKFPDGLTLDINPPKLRVLKQLISLSKCDNEKVLDELIEVIAIILNNNKQKRSIDAEFVAVNFSRNDMLMFIGGFYDWVTKVKNHPNSYCLTLTTGVRQ